MPRKVETKVVKRTKVEKEMTLLQAIEHVVEVSKDSKLKAEAKAEMSNEVRYIARRYGITERQAILFCVCMERGPRHVDYDDLASHLDVSNIRILSYAEDIDALVRRRLLRYRDAKDEDSFDIPQPVIKALKHNEVYELPARTGLDCAALFEVLDQMFEDLDDDAITPNDLIAEINALFKNNPQVSFAKQVKELSRLSPQDKLLLLFFCHRLVNKDDDDIRFGQMEDCFSTSADFINAKGLLRSGEHPLMEKKLIEHRYEDGIADTTRYKLTEQTKRTFLAEMKINTSEEKLSDVIKAKDLKAKEMFYVEENRKQVTELKSFLAPEKYNEIRERMQKTGFRTGFACLFYGGPGTGKTETAYQLARETGRDIMIVDLPQIKSKWVGDYNNVVLTKVYDVAATPADPEVTYLLFTETDYPYVNFNIPAVDTDGNPMMLDKLFYTVWYEEGGTEKKFIVLTDDYVNVSSDMEEIPYNFNDYYDIYRGGKTFYLNPIDFDYTTWTKLGIQSIYYGGNERHESNIVWIDPVGIKGLTPDSALSKSGEVIYNLAGQRIGKSQMKAGIYIVNGKKVVVK